MDPALLAVALAIALVVVSAMAWRDSRTLARVASLLGAADGSGAGVEARAASLAGAAARTEAALEALRSDVVGLVAELPVGIVVLDDELIVREANPAAHAIAERAPGTMVGRPVIEAFVEPRLGRVVAAAVGSGSAGDDLDLAGPDARSWRVRVHRRAAGGLAVTVEDLTELRRLGRIRAEFVDNLSHELRTPLTNLSLLAEALARDAEASIADERARDRIAKIETETGHLVEMVNELLDLARIEGGQAVDPTDEIDMSAVAHGAVRRMQPFADQQGVEIRLESADAAPAIGDETRLTQVLLNLLHNAIKFSPSGSVVTVEVSADSARVTTSVIDAGIGIRTSDQPRVFERFFKVDRARVGGGGAGLGLAIAKHIVEAHGGRIGVRSREGHGSTFWFSLPRANPEGEAGERAERAPYDP